MLLSSEYMSRKTKKKTLESTKKTDKNATAAHAKNKTALIAGIVKKIPKISTTPSFPSFLSKIQAGLFLIASIAFLLFAGFFLFEKIFRPQSLDNFLPADNTVAFLEINIDKNAQQVKNFLQVMKNHVAYQPASLMETINRFVSVDYARDLEPWLGRKLGLALIKPVDGAMAMKPVVFVEMKKIDKTISFLKNHVFSGTGDELISESYKGFSLYRYKMSQNFNVLFLSNYAIFAENDILLKQIVDSQLKPSGKLKNNALYQKIVNNLPQGALGFCFVNNGKFFNSFLASPIFQSQKVKDIVALEPFLKIFQASGFVLFTKEKNLGIQSFTSINRNELHGLSYLTFNDKYKYKLLSLADENPVFLAGGHDLYKELQRMQEVFQAGTKASSLIFDGLLKAQKQKYFGKDVSLNDDFYPLLKNEYLFTIDNNLEKPVVSVFLELGDKTNDIARFEKIVSAFIKTGAIFSPLIQQITLADGTKGEEIIANMEEITRSSQNYENININTLKLGNLPWSINYAFLDKTLVVSTNLETLKNVIDRAGKDRVPTGRDRSVHDFTKTNYFRAQLQSILGSADEFFHLKIGAVTDTFGLNQNPALKDFLAPFTSLSVAKNYFDDGVSTIYLIDVL